MTTTPTDPTTDDLTDGLAAVMDRWLKGRDAGWDVDRDDLARALLASGPLADRLTAYDECAGALTRALDRAVDFRDALTRVETLADEFERIPNLVGTYAAARIRNMVRGDR